MLQEFSTPSLWFHSKQAFFISGVLSLKNCWTYCVHIFWPGPKPCLKAFSKISGFKSEIFFRLQELHFDAKHCSKMILTILQIFKKSVCFISKTTMVCFHRSLIKTSFWYLCWIYWIFCWSYLFRKSQNLKTFRMQNFIIFFSKKVKKIQHRFVCTRLRDFISESA